MPDVWEDHRVGNSAIKRRRLAATLRRLREDAGRTLDEVSDQMGLAQSTMSRIETARAGARPAIVRGLLTLYGVHGDEAEVIVQIAKDATRHGWWYSYRDVIPDWLQTFVGFEAEASLIQTYEPQLVPDLLQTEEYARAILGAAWRKLPPAEVDRRVQARLNRQEILTRRRPPEFHVVLSEAVLRCQVGSPAVFAGQMARLVEAVDDRKVSIQVLPFAAGPVASERGPYVVLDFPDPEDPPVGYLEHVVGGLLVEDPAQIQECRAAFGHQCAAALSERESRKLISELAQQRG
jgi:transcriptional regulator with XRE-family HTH domain